MPTSALFWSVMIPTYRPSERYLRETLAALLDQAPAADRMQIEVVDDCSPDVDVGAMVANIAGERAAFHRNDRNLGLAGCWNLCVQRARGEWVHLLHQDDLVFPGFYAEMELLAARFPTAAALCSRHAFIDEHAAWTCLSPIESHEPAILSDWQFRLTRGQRLQCPSVVVRRSAYSELGRFRTDLPYCLDWEMWTRIAAAHPVAHTPKILAGYREHPGSESARLRQRSATLFDFFATFDLLIERLPADRREAARAGFASYIVSPLLTSLQQHYAAADFATARRLIELATPFPFAPMVRREIDRMRRNITLKRWLRWNRGARSQPVSP